MKVAEHTGGAAIDDPAKVDRAIDPIEQRRVADFLAAHLPEVSTRVADHAVCLYTMSPDEHFIVDRHPLHSNVVFAAGLSGHGFKFTPVLGPGAGGSGARWLDRVADRFPLAAAICKMTLSTTGQKVPAA